MRGRSEGGIWASAWLAVAAVIALGGVGMGAAGPADLLKIAPPTHEAFIYVDVAQMRTTKLYQDLEKDLLNESVRAGLAEFEQFTGMRLPDDLDIAAASGKIAQETKGCIYLGGRMDRQRIEAVLSANPGYTEISKPSGKIIGFLDEGKGTMSYLSFLRDDLVVVGQKEAVEASVDAAGGQSPSLADNAKVEAQIAGAGTDPMVLILALRPQSLPPDLIGVPIIQNIQSGLLTLVSGPTTMTVSARLEAESPEMAATWLEAIRGLIAIGQLQQKSLKLAEVAQHASAAQDGKTVAVRLEFNAAKAGEVVRQAVAAKRTRADMSQEPSSGQW